MESTSIYEDPKEQLFVNSMQAMYEIGVDESVGAKDRITALNEIQKSYLALQGIGNAQDMSRELSKAVKQVRRLQEGDE